MRMSGSTPIETICSESVTLLQLGTPVRRRSKDWRKGSRSTNVVTNARSTGEQRSAAISFSPVVASSGVSGCSLARHRMCCAAGSRRVQAEFELSREGILSPLCSSAPAEQNFTIAIGAPGDLVICDLLPTGSRDVLRSRASECSRHQSVERSCTRFEIVPVK